jgi:hypothetical protein
MVGYCDGNFLNEKMYLLFPLFLKCNHICGKYIGIALVQFQMLFNLLHTFIVKTSQDELFNLLHDICILVHYVFNLDQLNC